MISSGPVRPFYACLRSLTFTVGYKPRLGKKSDLVIRHRCGTLDAPRASVSNGTGIHDILALCVAWHLFSVAVAQSV